MIIELMLGFGVFIFDDLINFLFEVVKFVNNKLILFDYLLILLLF